MLRRKLVNNSRKFYDERRISIAVAKVLIKLSQKQAENVTDTRWHVAWGGPGEKEIERERETRKWASKRAEQSLSSRSGVWEKFVLSTVDNCWRQLTLCGQSQLLCEYTICVLPRPSAAPPALASRTNAQLIEFRSVNETRILSDHVV